MRFIIYLVILLFFYRLFKYIFYVINSNKKNTNNFYYKANKSYSGKINEKDIIDAEFEEIKNTDDKANKNK